MSARLRLDLALERRGLLPSRARARDAILRGTVTVNGSAAKKPGQMVAADDRIDLDDPGARYVSRAALKLAAGLARGEIDPKGKTCLDIGASTGGFTQLLLERGAAKIYAVDVGHAQLHPDLRADPRVVSLEGTDARQLQRAGIDAPIDLLLADVSFVSLRKVLEIPLALCRERAEAVVLFKPQFEVGRAHIGKGGIVRDDAAGARASADALAATIDFFGGAGFRHNASIASPIAGGDGNRETLLVFSRGAG